MRKRGRPSLTRRVGPAARFRPLQGRGLHCPSPRRIITRTRRKGLAALFAGLPAPGVPSMQLSNKLSPTTAYLSSERIGAIVANYAAALERGEQPAIDPFCSAGPQ